MAIGWARAHGNDAVGLPVVLVALAALERVYSEDWIDGVLAGSLPDT